MTVTSLYFWWIWVILLSFEVCWLIFKYVNSVFVLNKQHLGIWSAPYNNLYNTRYCTYKWMWWTLVSVLCLSQFVCFPFYCLCCMILYVSFELYLVIRFMPIKFFHIHDLWYLGSKALGSDVISGKSHGAWLYSPTIGPIQPIGPTV